MRRDVFVFVADERDGGGMMRTRILIAEDEPEIAMSLEFLLRNDGYEVEIARDGEAALLIARQLQPDLLVLDLMLPRLSGLDVCEAVRRDAGIKPPKVLILTARGSAHDMARGRSAGADAYLVKPFSTKELLVEVRRLLSPEGVQNAA